MPNTATCGHIKAFWYSLDDRFENKRLECSSCNLQDGRKQSEIATRFRRMYQHKINKYSVSEPATGRPFEQLLKKVSA